MRSKRDNYATYAGDNKAKVVKFAAENGVMKAILRNQVFY